MLRAHQYIVVTLVVGRNTKATCAQVLVVQVVFHAVAPVYAVWLQNVFLYVDVMTLLASYVHIEFSDPAAPTVAYTSFVLPYCCARAHEGRVCARQRGWRRAPASRTRASVRMKYVPDEVPVVEKSKMRGQLSMPDPGALYFARMTNVKAPVPKFTLCRFTYGPVVDAWERGLNSTDCDEES